jgi:hypothetical protein
VIEDDDELGETVIRVVFVKPLKEADRTTQPDTLDWAVARKVVVETPWGTVTVAGTITAPLLEARPTVRAGLELESVTEQVAGTPTMNRLGLQTREVNVGVADNVRVVLCEMAPSVAVTVALWLVLRLAVVALNVPIDDPPAIVNDAGTVSAAFVLDSFTDKPPTGAAWFRFNVQVLEALGPRFAGAQFRDVGTVVAVSPTVVLTETLFSVAVMIALWLPLRPAVVTLNVPVADPPITSIEDGAVRAAFVLESVIKEPLSGAARLRVTVQVLDAFGPRLPGAQVSNEGVTGAGAALTVRGTLAIAEL